MSETKEMGVTLDGTINVSSTTNVVRLSDTIYLAIIKDKVKPIIKTIGSQSIGQMVKALTRTRARLLNEGIDIWWYSHWQTVLGGIDGKRLSQIVTKVEIRQNSNEQQT